MPVIEVGTQSYPLDSYQDLLAKTQGTTWSCLRISKSAR